MGGSPPLVKKRGINIVCGPPNPGLNLLEGASQKVGVKRLKPPSPQGRGAYEKLGKGYLEEDLKLGPLVLPCNRLNPMGIRTSFKKIYGPDIDKKAKEFAISSYRNGLDGFVCSAFESRMVKEITSKDFITLSPAIRPFKEEAGDQKRVADLDLLKRT